MMKLLESFGEVLAREWEKASIFVKIGTIITAALEGLVLFVLKNEVVDVLNRMYPRYAQESLLALVIFIVPVFSFGISLIFSRMGKKFVENRTIIPSDSQSSTSNLIDAEIKDYKIVREISKSGFSKVFLVTERLSGRKYLLKELRQGQVQLQKLPNFPGLATPILEFESDGKIHQLLDYYDGWTLAKIIELNQDSSGVYGALLFSWTNQLLDILVPLHRNSPPIVHRDINPSNILVRSDTLELVLLDTSCAIYATPKSSQTPVGTLAHSAPEQLEGRAVPASDIYSLGMTLYAINHCNLPPVASARMYGRRESLELIKIPETVGLDSMFQQSINLDLNTRLKDAVQAKRLLSSPLTEPNGKLGTLKLPSGGRIEQYTLAWYYTGPDGKEVKGSLKDS